MAAQKKGSQTMDSYEDLLDLLHPTSKRHPRMSMTERAAQFSPFSALTGYGAVIRETGRLTDERIELDEYEKERLNDALQDVRKKLSAHPRIRVTYFVRDQRKDGGAYVLAEERVKKLGMYGNSLILEDGTEIAAEDILELVQAEENS